MKRLLTIEYKKILENKASFVLSIIYFGLLLALGFLVLIPFKIGTFEINLGDLGFFKFPEVWHFTSYIAGMLKIFLAIIVISSVTMEYTNRTLKQNLIDGLSKWEFILTKYLMVVVNIFISMIIVGIMSYLFGIKYAPEDLDSSLIFKEVYYLFTYGLELLAYLTFALFFAILCKKSFLAIITTILLAPLAETTISGIVYYLYYKVLNKGVEIIDKINLHDYLPFGANRNLIKQPFTRLDKVEDMSKMINVQFDYLIPTTAIVFNIIYTALFLGLTYWILKRRDL